MLTFGTNDLFIFFYIFNTSFFNPVFHLFQWNLKMVGNHIFVDPVGTDIFLYFGKQHFFLASGTYVAFKFGGY